MNSIRDMTDRRGEGATVVCVTQDFSTVQVLDDVMVVDQGRLAEHGNQAALMEQESSLFARMKRRMQGFSVNSKGQPTISAEVLKSTWAFNGVELAALRNLAAAFTSRYFRENEVRAACDAHDAREPRACAWARGEKCPRLTFVRRRRTSPPSFPLGPSASKLQR
jgi:ABC-type multidrug transport system ATPase subunit